jgi:hypothetical protein
MVKPLPKWLFLRYARIWKEKNSAEFGYDEIRALLRERDDRTLSVILSDLRRNGWLEVTLDPLDARKRTYRLRNPEEMVEEIARESKL